MKGIVKFSEGVAKLSLEASLPLPEAPLEVRPVPGDAALCPSALQQIEALLPAAVSELLFGRIE